MRPPLRQPPVARPVELPAGPARPGAHAARLAHWSAAPQSAVATEHSGRSSLSCPSGVVLLSVVFCYLPWEATPPHFYSAQGTRSTCPHGPVVRRKGC